MVTGVRRGQTVRRSAAVRSLCVAYLSFGMPFAMMGVAWPEARGGFGQPSSMLGVLAAVAGLGRLSTSASGGALLARFGMRRSATGACVVLALCNAVLVVTPAYAVFVAAFLFVGVASGMLDSLGARYLATVRDVGAGGLLAGSYGVGSTLGPGVIALTHWRVGFVVAALASALAAMLLGRGSLTWPAALHDDARSARARRRASEQAEQPLIPWVAVTTSLAVFAVFVALEVTAGQWGATFLEDHRGTSGRTAGLATSGFWAGITVGRLLLGRVHVPARRLLLGSITLALIAFSLAAVAPLPVAVAAFLAAGVAIAPGFPTLLATTSERVGDALAGRVSGWQLVAANIAATGLAALTGLIVDLTGPGAPIVVLVVVTVAGLAALQVSLRVAAGRRP